MIFSTILLAQGLTDTAKLIEQAQSESGWIAGMFALIVFAGFSLLGWFVRQLWLDQREMHDYQRDTLTSLITHTHDLLTDVRTELAQFRTVLQQAPCGTAIRQMLEKHWPDIASVDE